MITLFVVPLILAFGPAAVGALRVGGLRRLWLLCALPLQLGVAFAGSIIGLGVGIVVVVYVLRVW